MFLLRVARNKDHIHQLEEDRDSLRREVRMLAGRVRGLEHERDYDEMRILHAYDDPEETRSLVQSQ